MYVTDVGAVDVLSARCSTHAPIAVCIYMYTSTQLLFLAVYIYGVNREWALNLWRLFPSCGWSQPMLVDLAYVCARLWTLLLSNVLDFIQWTHWASPDFQLSNELCSIHFYVSCTCHGFTLYIHCTLLCRHWNLVCFFSHAVSADACMRFD